MFKHYQLVAVAVLICAFTLGLLTAPRPASAFSTGDIIKAGLLFGGVSWVVREYGSKMNDFINNALSQHDAAIAGDTKVVPIFRLGAKGIGGTAVGAAQVMGPAEQIKQVTYVLEVEPIGGDTVRVRGLIPLSTRKDVTSSVKGVGGVGVSANIKFPI